MCEIQFAISNKNIISGDIKNLLNMGYANGNRDATGILTYGKDGWGWAKTSGSYWQLLDTNGNCKKLLSTANAIIGHNRWTTHGSADKNDNNHPFVVGDWVLIHNGILYSDNTAKKIISDYDTLHPQYAHIETDSFAFFKVFLSFIGHETSDDAVHSAIENTIGLHNGDFSIFITNTKTNRGYYFRCGARHFYFKMYVKDDVWKILGSTTEDNLSLLTKNRNAGLFRQITTAQMYEFVPDKHVLYVIDYKATQFDSVITKHDVLKYAERERIYYESDVECPSEAEWFTLYPVLSEFFRKRGIYYEDIDWIDDDSFYVLKNFTQNDYAELDLACDADDVRISAVSGNYNEFYLKSWVKIDNIFDEEEKEAWRTYDGAY